MKNKITIINSGYGNLKSLANAFDYLNCDPIITEDRKKIENAKILILPGVGSFNAGIKSLKKNKIFEIIKQKTTNEKTPILGICLGMHLLCAKSNEHGDNKGLNLIPYNVESFTKKELKNLKSPHMGFNQIKYNKNSKLLDGLNEKHFYFAHSYRIAPKKIDNENYATCKHGIEFLAIYEKENIFATQFHPEKSQSSGIKVLSNFLKNSC